MYWEDLKESMLPECFLAIFLHSLLYCWDQGKRELITKFHCFATSFLSQKPFGYVLLMGIRKIFSNHDIGRIFMAKVIFLKKESLGRATVYQIRPPIQWNSMAHPSLNAYFLFRLAPKEVVRQTVFHIQTATSSVMLGKSLNFCSLSCKMVKIIPPLLWLNERIHIKHLAWYQKTQ